jgi:hypothetical protein
LISSQEYGGIPAEGQHGFAFIRGIRDEISTGEG